MRSLASFLGILALVFVNRFGSIYAGETDSQTVAVRIVHDYRVAVDNAFKVAFDQGRCVNLDRDAVWQFTVFSRIDLREDGLNDRIGGLLVVVCNGIGQDAACQRQAISVKPSAMVGINRPERPKTRLFDEDESL